MTRLFFCIFLWSLPLFSLTIEEKVGQILLVHVREETSQELIEKTHIGGVILYRFLNDLTEVEKVQKLTDTLQTTSRIPLFIAVDQEGGRVNALQFYSLPSQREQTSLPIEELTLQMGKVLKDVGINVNFSPVVDVDSNPDNPIIGNRSFSSDPNEVIRCAKEALAGYRQAGILCCLKHFPGHGDSKVDSHFSLPLIEKSREELEKTELAPFFALHSDVDLIMTGHLLVPALDPDCPATLSYKILTELLRHKWGYRGAIISDSLIMRALNQSNLKETALKAFNAGCDILCISGRIDDNELSVEDYVGIHRFLVEAVKNGSISEKRLDESVARILDLKAKYL